MQVTSQVLDVPATRKKKNPSSSGLIVEFPKQLIGLVSLDC